jgi:hypothetical protein
MKVLYLTNIADRYNRIYLKTKNFSKGILETNTGTENELQFSSNDKKIHLYVRDVKVFINDEIIIVKGYLFISKNNYELTTLYFSTEVK